MVCLAFFFFEMFPRKCPYVRSLTRERSQLPSEKSPALLFRSALPFRRPAVRREGSPENRKLPEAGGSRPGDAFTLKILLSWLNRGESGVGQSTPRSLVPILFSVQKAMGVKELNAA